ncbi:MAG: T9SS type A sorting domain-containing protein [Melioribacteraceae bacterium]|nr:T9SS type A sorting domain-containing protein [Melioribacteraceae bacterium]
MKSIVFRSIIFIISINSFLLASNDLSVKDKNLYGSKKGYIEKTTLVIEPFGSYVEQSLYLEYSERNQFSSSLLEIVHRFELPKDAVVKDMWLWMGDSVMQAQMYDTWTARGIYDSIAATKYDPAFLTKTGTQYELRIYPLAAGSFRKVKITFIVPTRWYGNQATAELPLKMLLSNNSSKKPLEILFRYKTNIWCVPKISELPQKEFVELTDTLNYKYKHVLIDDISSLSSLNMEFNTEFSDGYYINGYQDKSDSTYFQLGILPENFFEVKPDSSSHNILFAMDFSGSLRKDLPNKLPIYRSLIKSSLKENDNFKLLVSGNGEIVDYTHSFLHATSLNINKALDNFEQSDFAKTLNEAHSTNLLFCDHDAVNNWSFNDLSSIANVTQFDRIQDAINSITKFDVVAAYAHGFDYRIDQETANQVIERLDSLFINGGRFLSYYDYNRENSEILARHYIQGLKVKKVIHDAVTLYRNSDGNIASSFPETITRNASYFLETTDPDVKIELRDKDGDAAVISKKIGNGLIVVSGIWSMKDDAGIKSLLNPPLLSINSSKNPFNLDDLLAHIKNEYSINNFTKVILLSDSDSLIAKVDANNIAKEYINGYAGNFPKFSSVNLLESDIITPGYIIDGLTEYYGSGYLLKKLAEESNGLHLEKHLNDWSYITSAFSPYAIPFMKELKINAAVDNGSGQIFEMREVNKISDPNKPRFFLGLSDAINSIKFNISGRFEGDVSESLGTFTFLVPRDSTTNNEIVKSMLGNEKIKDLFYENPIDTAKVLELSMKHNLLTDYTALLALEPDDRFHFLRNPLDESDLSVINEENIEDIDSISVAIYPNPFNNMATIKLNLKSISNVTAIIYNILGERVKDLADVSSVSGVKTFTWYGKNNYGTSVSSGLYIVRFVVTDSKTGKENILTNKLLLMK